MNYVEGFDCAWPQGTINWDKVPEKYRFVFVQVANGVKGRDPTGPLNLAGARRTSRLVFAYLFFNAEQDSTAQAENFWQACGETAPACIAIDFETLAKGLTPGAAVDMLQACIAACRERFGGIKIVVYTYPNFAKQVVGSVLAHAAIDAELWMADYSKGEQVDGKKPVLAAPWGDWKFWQTSGNNSTFIEGINGHVDHDVFNGSEQELRAWLGLDGQGEAATETVHPDVDFPDRDYS